MKVALVIVQLGLTAGATEDGIRKDIEHVLSRAARVERWPEGHFYYSDTCLPRHPTRVKRVLLMEVPEGS